MSKVEKLKDTLKARHVFRRVASNAGWLAFDRMLKMAVGLFVGVWVARYLGPDQYGLLNWALAVVALAVPLAGLGLESLLVRDLVREPGDAADLLGTGLVLKLAGGLAAWAALLAVLRLAPPQDPRAAGLAAITALGLVALPMDVVDLWFQSRLQSKYVVAARSTAFVLVALVRVTLILAKAPLAAFAWAGLAETVLAALGLAILYRWKAGNLAAWRFRTKAALQLLSQSWPLIFSNMASMVYMRIDTVMLEAMAGNHETGIYSAAQKFSELWYFIPGVLVASAAPAIIEGKKLGEKVYLNRLGQLFRFMSGVSIVIAVMMTFLSAPLIAFLLGPAYASAGPVLAIHIWSALPVFWAGAQLPWDTNEGLMKLLLARTLLGAALNVALNLYLIPAMGSRGAAIATAISYSAEAWLGNLLSRRTWPIFSMQCRSLLFWKPLE